MKTSAEKLNPSITDRHHGAMIVATPTLINNIAKKIKKRAGATRLPIENGLAMPVQLSIGRLGTGRCEVNWLWLVIGGLFEVGFTTSLRFVDGFRNSQWTLAFLVSVAISMALLELASRTIPMGTAYAVWGGIGAVGTVLVGMAFFNEPSTSVRLLLILAIVAAIGALRVTA